MRARELDRYGREAIAAGGPLHQAHVDFLDWAGRYDDGGVDMRSRALHETWVAALPGNVVRLEGVRAIADQLAELEAAVSRRLR